MIYEFNNGRVLTKALEYSVSYHCNLRCSGCAHLSPFSRKHFPSLESFVDDINQLSKGLHANAINLLGGEPLLNPDINSYIKAAKEAKIAETVVVVTNGLLLHKMDDEFWEHVDVVTISLYPDVILQEKSLSMFKKRAEETCTQLTFSPTPVFKTMVVTDPHSPDWITNMIYKTCKAAHAFHEHMVHEGRLYKCFVSPFLQDYLSKMGQNCYDPIIDSFDIHGSHDIFHDVKAFLTSTVAMKACSFCLGDAGKREEHHQLKQEDIANPRLQDIRRSTHLDTNKFLKDCALYYRRRALEKITGEQGW